MTNQASSPRATEAAIKECIDNGQLRLAYDLLAARPQLNATEAYYLAFCVAQLHPEQPIEAVRLFAHAERARQYRYYGSSGKYAHDTMGANSRLDELQAAFLRTRLTGLDAANARRRRLAAAYRERLAGIANLELPPTDDDSEPVYYLFVVLTARRDALAAGLAARRIATMVH